MKELLTAALAKYGKEHIGKEKASSRRFALGTAANTSVTFLRLREMLRGYGQLIEENEKEGTCIAVISTGAFASNRAMTVVRKNGSEFEIASYAREGLIPQHTAKKITSTLVHAIEKD